MVLEQVTHLSSADREIFARVVRVLLRDVFLLRIVENEEQLYGFALRNFAALEEWFAFVGLSVLKDEGLGVITFRGESGGRSNLNLDETLGLLVLLVLYNEKRNELSLRSEVTVQQVEFQDRYRVLTERTISKTRFVLMLRRLQSLKFLRVHGEAEDPGALLVLYPSIPFVLDGRDIEKLFATILAGSGEGSEEGLGDEFVTVADSDDDSDFDVDSDPDSHSASDPDDEADDEAGDPDDIDSIDDPEKIGGPDDIETLNDPEDALRRDESSDAPRDADQAGTPTRAPRRNTERSTSAPAAADNRTDSQNNRRTP